MNILITDDEQMVLRENKEMVGRVKPSAHLFCATTYIEAIKIIQTEQIDVAMLDIEMPEMNGLQLAARIKQESPDTNIIFVTAYTEYALEAFGMYASGYLVKPIRTDEIEKAFTNLRHPVHYEEDKLKVQCFGNFEVYYDGKPLVFARAKAKEIFAYLVDLQGASATTGELCAILWEDDEEIEKNKHYLRNLISDIKKALKAVHAQDVFICNRNQFSIDKDKIECDYYKFLQKAVHAVNSYRGEYMKQYIWAEFSMRHLL